jgi:hypothetical protein
LKETCLINVFLTAVPYLVDGGGNNGREKVKGCEEQRMVGTPRCSSSTAGTPGHQGRSVLWFMQVMLDTKIQPPVVMLIDLSNPILKVLATKGFEKRTEARKTLRRKLKKWKFEIV